VTWEKLPDGTPDLDTVRLRCPHCSGLFSNAEKDMAVADRARAHWIPTAPFRNGQRGYRLNSLYSPFPNVTLGKIVAKWHEAQGNPSALQNFYNTVLGEAYDGVSGEIQPEDLSTRAETYPAPVPRRTMLLTAGIDVQVDRLCVEVVGWTESYESWNIDYQILPGDPNIPEGQPGSPWDAMTALLHSEYQHELGFAVRLRSACIDTGGHWADSVYRYCDIHRADITPLKGANTIEAAPYTFSNRRLRRTGARSLRLCIVGVHKLKSQVIGRLRIPDPGPGYCHFPSDRSPDYYDELTAEHLVASMKRNGRVEVWEKKSHERRNEALDCRVYAYCALLIKNVNWLWERRRLGKIAAHHAAQHGVPTPASPPLPAKSIHHQPSAPTAPSSAAPQRRARPRRSSGWMSR
jgi:phage terminase large subunit GpA-like protein